MSDLYYYGQQAMLKHGTKATPIPKVAADEIERLRDRIARAMVEDADQKAEIERLRAILKDWRITDE